MEFLSFTVALSLQTNIIWAQCCERFFILNIARLTFDYMVQLSKLALNVQVKKLKNANVFPGPSCVLPELAGQ